MCDTLCALSPTGTVFAKNSDRPVGERQLVEVHPRRIAGDELRTTYLSIPDTGSWALVGSRPEWCWGLEHGINEHGVAIGNEKIWTVDDPTQVPPALIGMDLVRLGLERASSAGEALDVMTGLLGRHGQGGNGEADGDPYWSSFLVADAADAWILETSGTTWAARAVPVSPEGSGGAAISNRVTLSADWDRASDDVAPGADFDDWRDPEAPTAIGDLRLAVTRGALAEGADRVAPTALAGVLRDHGGAAWGAVGSTEPVVGPPGKLAEDFTGISVCMHLRDYQVTAAAMIAQVPRDPAAVPIAWIAVGSPCVSVFLPTFPPFDVPGFLAEPTTWDRVDSLRARVEADPEALAPIRDTLGPLEAELWEEGDHAATGSPDARQAFVRSLEARLDAALTAVGT